LQPAKTICHLNRERFKIKRNRFLIWLAVKFALPKNLTHLLSPLKIKKLRMVYSEMKKVLASLLVLFVLMVSVPLSAEACPTHRRYRRSNVSRNYYAAPRYRTAGYVAKRPSFYRRHRNLINLGIATGAGALIGGIAKGKRGAGYGALIGAGSGALYTYVLNKKKRRY
jgi:hypothetical protein